MLTTVEEDAPVFRKLAILTTIICVLLPILAAMVSSQFPDAVSYLAPFSKYDEARLGPSDLRLDAKTVLELALMRFGALVVFASAAIIVLLGRKTIKAELRAFYVSALLERYAHPSFRFRGPLALIAVPLFAICLVWCLFMMDDATIITASEHWGRIIAWWLYYPGFLWLSVASIYLACMLIYCELPYPIGDPRRER